MDQNPYESPREAKPLTTGKIVKRALGVSAILLLTPLAVAIAFGLSCVATDAVASLPVVNDGGLERVIVVALAVFLIPPAVVLVGMIAWAIRTHLRNSREE